MMCGKQRAMTHKALEIELGLVATRGQH
uniref:Uncharacterized protein n=1 Tax=Anguilla anguilla TaxID=7936 RepID=A0A0E9W8I8_ANGAN